VVYYHFRVKLSRAKKLFGGVGLENTGGLIRNTEKALKAAEINLH